MTGPVIVRIVGAPIARKDGVKDSWRDVAAWAAGQLRAHFGEAVEVHYFDLFDVNCPPVPAGVQLPLVLVEDQVLSSGGKISVPAIRRKIESIMMEHAA